MMGLEAIAGIAVTVVLAVAGWVWKLSTRLAAADARITAAEALAASAGARADVMARDLAAHKEHVAAEYVSRDTMSEITGALNRLGDRLDNLFIHLMSKPNAQQ